MTAKSCGGRCVKGSAAQWHFCSYILCFTLSAAAEYFSESEMHLACNEVIYQQTIQEKTLFVSLSAPRMIQLALIPWQTTHGLYRSRYLIPPRKPNSMRIHLSPQNQTPFLTPCLVLQALIMVLGYGLYIIFMVYNSKILATCSAPRVRKNPARPFVPLCVRTPRLGLQESAPTSLTTAGINI